MNYTTLMTRPISSWNNNSISEVIIIEALESCYKNCAFSTFPYIMEQSSSIESIKKYKCGNCISLSMYLKEYLKKKYKISSILIPATIPDKYKYPGYLDISHVALAIPFTSGEIFIADPAFYFLNPIKLNIHKSENFSIFSKNIYQSEYNTDLSQYNSIDIVSGRRHHLSLPLTLNKYQSLPANIHVAQCSYKKKPKDIWKYFICEVVNPDEAITSFYISVKNSPFITDTVLDKNGIPVLSDRIKVENNIMTYSNELDNKITRNILDMNQKEIKFLEKKMKKYFKGNIKKYAKNIKKYAKNIKIKKIR